MMAAGAWAVATVWAITIWVAINDQTTVISIVDLIEIRDQTVRDVTTPLGTATPLWTRRPAALIEVREKIAQN
jgi:hypothetical protein